MTEKEHEELVRVSNEFWLAFSRLCNEYISKAPDHLRETYITHLGEQTSIYGRKRK